MTESWLQVEENDKYLVSNKGRVFGVYGKMLKPHENTGGYLRVSMSKNGKTIKRSIHSLVARAFIGRRPCGFQVCHLNGNKQDNRVENLKYVTPKENTSHKLRHGTMLRGDKHGMSKLKENEVVFIIEHYKPNDSKYSGIALAEMFGVTPAAISCIIQRQTWNHVKRG
jgi:hypothetical protein